MRLTFAPHAEVKSWIHFHLIDGLGDTNDGSRRYDRNRDDTPGLGGIEMSRRSAFSEHMIDGHVQAGRRHSKPQKGLRNKTNHSYDQRTHFEMKSDTIRITLRPQSDKPT